MAAFFFNLFRCRGGSCDAGTPLHASEVFVRSIDQGAGSLVNDRAGSGRCRRWFAKSELRVLRFGFYRQQEPVSLSASTI
jgi:hypothetical protein